MNNNTINSNRMDLLLAAVKGAKFAGLTTATETKLNKTNGLKGDERRSNPFHGKVLSIRNISALFNYDYDGNVAKALSKQDKDASEHKKGTSWMRNVLDENGNLSPFCEHKTNETKYLRLRTLHKGNTVYVAKDRIELDDGTIINAGDNIDFESIRPFFPAKKAYSNQGLDKGTEIAATTLKFESVRGLRINGERYVIRQNETDAAGVAAVIAGFVHDMPNVTAADVPADQTATV